MHHFKVYKTILSSDNHMNIYRGCTHGCIYCDSRSRCYKMDHNFEDIEVKAHALDILDAQLSRRKKPAVISTGAMGDPYIPLEESLQLTRGCLELIARHRFALAIQTKSSRILRDLDILKDIHNRTKCVVQMTMTTYDESLCRVIEPLTSTTYERYRVLKVMGEAGIPTVVWLSPFLPFINDTPENVWGLLDYCIRARVHGIICFGFGVTLREGNREYFYSKLDRWFPGMKERYKSCFGSSYICTSNHHAQLMHILQKACRRHNILLGTHTVFSYLRQFETSLSQGQLFP